MTTNPIEEVANDADALAGMLSYLAETADDPGLQLLLMHISDRANEMQNRLAGLAKTPAPAPEGSE